MIFWRGTLDATDTICALISSVVVSYYTGYSVQGESINLYQKLSPIITILMKNDRIFW